MPYSLEVLQTEDDIDQIYHQLNEPFDPTNVLINCSDPEVYYFVDGIFQIKNLYVSLMQTGAKVTDKFLALTYISDTVYVTKGSDRAATIKALLVEIDNALSTKYAPTIPCDYKRTVLPPTTEYEMTRCPNEFVVEMSMNYM